MARKQIKQITEQGLPNIGNTCFLNSCLQALYGNSEFRNLILRKIQDSTQARQKKLTKSLHNIFQSIRKNKGINVKRKHLKVLVNYLKAENVNYNGSSQEDSFQFLFLIIEKFIKENPNLSKLVKLYYKIQCKKCKINYKMQELSLCALQLNCQNQQCEGKLQMKFISVPKLMILQGTVFPENFQFESMKKEKLKYKIVSQIMYSGNGNSGHYVCYRKIDDNSQDSMLFNDSYVDNRRPSDNFQTKVALYQLIYQQQKKNKVQGQLQHKLTIKSKYSRIKGLLNCMKCIKHIKSKFNNLYNDLYVWTALSTGQIMIYTLQIGKNKFII